MRCIQCCSDIVVTDFKWVVYEQKVFCDDKCRQQYKNNPPPIPINQRRRQGDIRCIESVPTVESLS